MAGWIIIASAFGGLLLGSFANVVVHRVPAGRSVVRPGSTCPGCGAGISAIDNVPVLSWLFLRGRCRHCAAPIAWRYPALEAGMAAIFAVTAATADRPLDLVLRLPLVFAFVCLAAIDLETKRLPDALTLPTFVVGVLAAGSIALARDEAGLFLGALAAAAVAFVVFFAILLAAPGGGFGFGDVKLAPSLALVLGYAERGGARAFTGILLSFILGSVVGVALIAFGKAGRKTKLPFGPFLVIGTLVTLWTGDTFVRLWLGP